MAGEGRQLAFRQKTDKGYVYCQVTISLKICTRCGFASWDDAAEVAIERAVRQQYQRLP
jgi:hypothetical protein